MYMEWLGVFFCWNFIANHLRNTHLSCCRALSLGFFFTFLSFIFSFEFYLSVFFIHPFTSLSFSALLLSHLPSLSLCRWSGGGGGVAALISSSRSIDWHNFGTAFPWPGELSSNARPAARLFWSQFAITINDRQIHSRAVFHDRTTIRTFQMVCCSAFARKSQITTITMIHIQTNTHTYTPVSPVIRCVIVVFALVFFIIYTINYYYSVKSWD